MKQKLHETSVDILWVTAVLPEKLPSDGSFSQPARAWGGQSPRMIALQNPIQSFRWIGRLNRDSACKLAQRRFKTKNTTPCKVRHGNNFAGGGHRKPRSIALR